MKKIILILFLLTSLAAKSQTNTNSLPFTLMESGHIIIQAKVDGVEGKYL